MEANRREREMDDKGQVSAEMLVLMAAVLAVAWLVLSSLTSTAKSTTHSINKTSKKILNKVEEITG